MRLLRPALATLCILWASNAYSVDCQYRSTAPTLANQDLIILQCDTHGNLLFSNSGSSFTNYAANNTGVQVKSGAGVLTGIVVNTGGTTSTLTLYDGTSALGTKIGTFATTTQGFVGMNIQFSTGLFAVLAGAAAADVTIQYR